MPVYFTRPGSDTGAPIVNDEELTAALDNYERSATSTVTVDAAGNGDYTTLASAIAAVTGTGTLIRVLSNLTITSPIVISKTVTIEFVGGVKVYNNGAAGTDTFQTSVAVGVGSSHIDNVRIIRPRLFRAAGATGKAGKGFQMHGAYHWDIHWAEVDSHETGLEFDATPYPSGMCSHNTFWHPQLSNCDVGVHNGGYANINNLVCPGIVNCDLAIHMESGLDLNVVSPRVEHLTRLVTTDLIRVDAGPIYISDLHMEATTSHEPITLNSGAVAYISGNVYNEGGYPNVVIDDLATRYRLELNNEAVKVRNTGTAMTVTRTAVPHDAVAAWYGRDVDTGPDILRASIWSDGRLRLPPPASAPSLSLIDGDIYTKASANGGVETYQYQDGTWQRLLRLDDRAALFHRYASRIENLPRYAAVSDVAQGGGEVTISFFTALEDTSLSQLIMFSGATQSSGLSLARMGFYTVNGSGDPTLVARTASDTTLFNTANTKYTKSFDTTGGYPASYTIQRGETYGIGVIQVGTTKASLRGVALGSSGLTSMTPVMARLKASESDLQSLTAAGMSLTGNVLYVAGQ
jgi:hypothetical protein